MHAGIDSVNSPGLPGFRGEKRGETPPRPIWGPLPLPGFGVAFAGAGAGSGRKVHTGSTRLPVRWVGISKRLAARIYHQARQLDRRTHERGRHGGMLGHAALQVLHCLIYDFLNWKTGRLDPSYEAIAAKANLARSTVAAALRRLREAGILHWLRRCDERYEDGRYVLRQVSNAYGVVPSSQWRTGSPLSGEPPPPEPGTWGDHPPLPDQVGQAVEAAREGADNVEIARVLDLDRTDRLAAALARLSQAIDTKNPKDCPKSGSRTET